MHVFVTHGNEIAGYIQLDEADKERHFADYYTSKVYIYPDYRGKGVALAVYRAILNRGFSLASDEAQTPGSRAVWSNLARDPRYEVRIVTKGQKSEPITNTGVAYDDDRVRLIAREKI